MTSAPRRDNELLPHLERYLGRFEGDGVAEPEWNVEFSAFRWRDQPRIGIDVLASFGLSRHVLDGRRQEILVALDRRWERVALSIVVSVGSYLLDRHLPLGAGETVRIPSELDTPVQRLDVASADELVPGLGVCRAYEPPTELLWLRPERPDAFDLDA